MSDKDREQWIMHDESLYSWYRQSGLGLRSFIHANRDEISKTIRNKLGVSAPRDWTFTPKPTYRLTR